MWYLLYTFIVLTSVMFLPIPDAFGLPKQAVFIVMGFCMVAISLMNKDSKTLTLRNKWLSLIFLYTVLYSLLYHFFIPLFISNAKFIGFSMNSNLATLTIILSILIVQCLVEWTDDLNKWVKLGKFLCWVGLGFSAYAILQFIGVDQIFHKDFYWVFSTAPLKYKGEMFSNYRMITFLGNKRETAVFLTMLSPMCLMFKGLRYKLIYGTMFVAVLLTFSAIAIPIFIIGFLMYLLMTKRWKWSIAGFIGFILLGIQFLRLRPDFLNLHGKLELWKDVFMGTLSNFFVGHGIGSFPLLGYNVNSNIATNADFGLLQLLSDGGLILVGLVIGYAVTLYIRIFWEFLSSNSMLLIGYTIGLTLFSMLTFGASPLHYPALFLIGLCYIAGLEAQTQGG